ncbi:MAG: GNAT family N-acetyltransferase [Candidatus Aenigmarchaeota archaeon]|nr:GNAT family N-acetyltransferase [Candidatus Aenigmarchaeota archaeon]
MKIRNLRKNDYVEVLELIKEQIKYQNKLDGFGVSLLNKKDIERIKQKFDKSFGSRNLKYFVAEINKKIVGYLTLTIRKDNLRKKGYVGDLFVSQECRGKKMGEKLMKYTQDYCKKLSCESVELDVFANNEAAIKLHEKLKYKKIKVNYRKKLR